LNEHGVVGDEWKASRSWEDEQRRRPSGHELAGPTRSPPQRGSAAANQRGKARPTLEALRTDGAAKSLFYTGFKMLPAIKQELDKIERTFCGFQYQLDHTECIALMILKIARYGVEGRLILDKTNFYKSSCARQAARVHELYQAGCQIRISKPSYGNFSCVHVKCFVLDGKVVLTGSMNLPHNGLENNKEHLYRLTEPAFVAEVLADFEKEWLTAEPVTGKEISKMLDADLKRQNKKREQSMSRPSDGNQPGGGPSSVENARGSWHGLPCRNSRASQPALRMQDRCRDPQDLDREKQRLAADEQFAKESIGRRLLKGNKGQVVGYFNEDRDVHVMTLPAYSSVTPEPPQANEFGIAAGSSRYP
jgi:phosphatidylserine/phosphatidylglycerophosphate/cardiolipin synthase-like enzyme